MRRQQLEHWREEGKGPDPNHGQCEQSCLNLLKLCAGQLCSCGTYQGSWCIDQSSGTRTAGWSNPCHLACGLRYPSYVENAGWTDSGLSPRMST